jgi:hypothetical protein
MSSSSSSSLPTESAQVVEPPWNEYANSVLYNQSTMRIEAHIDRIVSGELDRLMERFSAPEWLGMRAFIRAARPSTRMEVTMNFENDCSVVGIRLADKFVFSMDNDPIATLFVHPNFRGFGAAIMLLGMWRSVLLLVTSTRRREYADVRYAQLNSAFHLVRLVHPGPRNSSPFAIQHKRPPPPHLTNATT